MVHALSANQTLVLNGRPKRPLKFQYGVKVALERLVVLVGPKYVAAVVEVISARPLPPGTELLNGSNEK
jgi:hypothetical protein